MKTTRIRLVVGASSIAELDVCARAAGCREEAIEFIRSVAHFPLAIIDYLVPANQVAYLELLSGLVLANMVDIRIYGLPSLYASNIRYARECDREEWLGALAVNILGKGDCDDLVAYRVAELNLHGVESRIKLRMVGENSYHWQVILQNGQIEDPSLILGMGSEDDNGANCVSFRGRSGGLRGR